VGDALQASEDRQPREVGVVDPANLEHAVGADLHTVTLSFTARAIDDRAKFAGGGAALLAGAVGMLRRATRLLGLDPGFAHDSNPRPRAADLS